MQNRNENYRSDLRKRTYRYSIDIIELFDKVPKDSVSQIIGKQLLRSATSIGANIIEAQASSSRKDFTNFIIHSLKSANESLYWLGLLRDAKRVKDLELEPLLKETHELANILGSSVLTLKGKKKF